MKHRLRLLFVGLTLCSVASANDWMSKLPDDMYVSTVSIPGAHDAATGYGFTESLASMGNTYARTQDIDMSAQWALGVRAFDLRPSTREGYLHINHGIMETKARFDSVMYMLRDSLIAHPTEFAVIHLLHADDGDKVENVYESLFHKLIDSPELKDYLVDFRRDLTVEQARGKILFLYRDSYEDRPIGGIMTGWCGWIDWNVQTQGSVRGLGNTVDHRAPLYMQDLSETHKEGALDEKKSGITQMLNFSTTHSTLEAEDAVWVFNFLSAYSKVGIFNISLSDGYRDNATFTHACLLDYLADHPAGPTGIVLADYVGVDSSYSTDGSSLYATRGRELVDTLIANNFKYLKRVGEKVHKSNLLSIKLIERRFSSVKSSIASECPNVASQFDDKLTAMRNELDSLIQDELIKYESLQLVEHYSFPRSTYYSLIDDLLTAARQAQQDWEDSATAVMVPEKKDNVYVIESYDLAGKKSGRGNIRILKYSDGSIKKLCF